MVIKTIEFFNSTIFPLSIDEWRGNTILTRYVNPNETCVLFSETGEWYVHKTFYSEYKQANEFWKKMGYGNIYPYLGKFRSEPCISGNYSWMDYDKFDAVYDNGMIVLIMK